MKYLFPTLLLLFVSPLACADSFSLHLASQHLPPGDYNEDNFGVGYMHDINSDWRVSGSVLRNSYDNTSVIVCGHYGGRLSVGVCGATGYENEIDGVGEILPMPQVSLRLWNGPRIAPRITFIPDGHGGGVGLLSLDIKIVRD